MQHHLPDLQDWRGELAVPFLSSTSLAAPVQLYPHRFRWHFGKERRAPTKRNLRFYPGYLPCMLVLDGKAQQHVVDTEIKVWLLGLMLWKIEISTRQRGYTVVGGAGVVGTQQQGRFERSKISKGQFLVGRVAKGFEPSYLL